MSFTLIKSTEAKTMKKADTFLHFAAERITLGKLQLNLNARSASFSGKKAELTAQECELLKALMETPNKTISREELLRSAWGYQAIGQTRTVDVHVQRLRRKLGSDLIETVYRSGYRLAV